MTPEKTKKKEAFHRFLVMFPIGSMYGIFTYRFTIKNQPNVGKSTIHGSYGFHEISMNHLFMVRKSERQRCLWMCFSSVLPLLGTFDLEDGLPVNGSVVNNHGTMVIVSPLRIGLDWTPSIHGLFISFYGL